MFYKSNRFSKNRGEYFKKKFSHGTLSKIALLQAIKKSQADNTITQQPEKHVFTSFTDFPLSIKLQKNLIEKGYSEPTPIQDQVIPLVLQGKDVIGIANTGTGKTAAFLLPLIEKVILNNREKVLIITPTRELALQVYTELRGFTKGTDIFSVLLIGGNAIGRQKNELLRNPHFVIGTPGRIKDLIREKNLILGVFRNIVLDEADRMVDIGFIEDIKYFISLLPRQRQSLFFSATMSGKVKEIIENFVHDPVFISVKIQETARNIHQEVIQVKNRQKKIEQLHTLLINKEFEKVVIFGRTKWGVQKLGDELISRGFKAGIIHGNKKQNHRKRTLEEFKDRRINILLATDVASRGLDLHEVSHVINYDLPATYEDYVHRIGRTGRLNKKGTALTFIE